ncbi:MAG: thiolase family protein, partial [Chloroflexota bacterium]
EIPCNTSGGMLSESYMQSWNHQPELVRQLRHAYAGGPRQVEGAEVAQYVHDVAGKCLSVIYTRGQ